MLRGKYGVGEELRGPISSEPASNSCSSDHETRRLTGPLQLRVIVGLHNGSPPWILTCVGGPPRRSLALLKPHRPWSSYEDHTHPRRGALVRH
jgi:hypothetical protein